MSIKLPHHAETLNDTYAFSAVAANHDWLALLVGLVALLAVAGTVACFMVAKRSRRRQRTPEKVDQCRSAQPVKEWGPASGSVMPRGDREGQGSSAAQPARLPLQQ